MAERSPARPPESTSGSDGAGSTAADAVDGGTADRSPGLREPGERGSLTLSDTAVETLVRAATLEVDGVARAESASGPLSGLLGSRLPRADVDQAGTRARVEVDIATVWPLPAADVAARVRTSVTTRLRELAALDVDTVAVTVAKVTRPVPPSPQRRVR